MRAPLIVRSGPAIAGRAPSVLPGVSSSVPEDQTRPHVLVISGDVERGSAVRAQIGAGYHVSVRASRSEMVSGMLDGPPVSAVVTDLWDVQGLPVAPAVKAARSLFPTIPILVYCPLTPATAAEILVVARAGINSLVLHGFDDIGAKLSQLIARAADDCDASHILSALRPFLRESELPIVEYCVSHAKQKMSVGQVASAMSMSRRTLSYRLASGRLCSVHSLIVWCRLLVAARLLQDPGRTIESVARTLHFGSAAAFRNMLRRHVGIGPAQLRTGGGLPFLLNSFTKLLASRNGSGRMSARPSPARRRSAPRPSGDAGAFEREISTV